MFIIRAFRVFSFDICAVLMVCCGFAAFVLEPSWGCLTGWITAIALFVRVDTLEEFSSWLVKKLKKTEEVVLVNGLTLPNMDE